MSPRNSTAGAGPLPVPVARAAQHRGHRRAGRARGDLQRQVAERAENRLLRLGELQSYLGPAVQLMPEADDVTLEFAYVVA